VGFAPTFYFGLKMVDHLPIAARVNAIAESVAQTQGVELVHSEIVGSKRDSLLRIYIDKDGGVGIDDCSRFSSAVEELLDAEDLIPWAYVLEISSPGIERELYSLKDFVRFVGELAKVKTRTEIGGQKSFIGRIERVEGEEIVFEDRTSGEVRIPFGNVEKANLKIDLAKELKGR
jgi:ribosome maturation factor RimP